MSKPTELIDVMIKWNDVFMRGQMTGFVRYAKQCGLSMSQAGVLFRLHRRGLSKGVSDIGDYLGVTSAAASQLLDRLVQQGLISRTEDPEDRRTKRLSLTERGRRVIEEALRSRQRWFTSLAKGMTEEERTTVSAGLEILTRKIEESTPDEECTRQ
jgi:DNA-binding MarR family transcriptional regulator